MHKGEHGVLGSLCTYVSSLQPTRRASGLNRDQTLDTMIDGSTLRLSLLVASLFVAPLLSSWCKKDPLLAVIPTVGFSDSILSYFTALCFVFDGPPMLKYGYEKSRRGLFKIARFRRWMVLASSPELIEDIRKAPDHVLSLNAALREVLQPAHTLDLLELDNDYHTDLIRSKLTRNVAETFNEVHDELVRSLDASIPVHGDDWVKIPLVETVQYMVCATTNRVLVGTSLCA
jgi:hypothetical protein